MPEKKTFFISRAVTDKRWAELIASVVRDAGHEAFFEDEHFHVGKSIPDIMRRGAEADCTIAVWSPAYFESEHCVAELNAAVMQSPLGHKGKLIPVRVAPVEIPNLHAQPGYLDLVGIDDDSARQRLMTILVKLGHVNPTYAVTGRTRRVVERANRNRITMIEKVRAIWITGFLVRSLPQQSRVVLAFSEKPDAVSGPLDLSVWRPDEVERPVPAGTRVVDVYDATGHSLLILGAPGSGKTTFLLELTRDLLDRADRDPAHPIPVVFPLSTWAEKRKRLTEWLQDELNLRYDVPRVIAREWVATDQVLPLLDGLDEVKTEHRAACVASINRFRHSHGLLPLVISSRTDDYEALANLLRLGGAIRVRPITREQVNTYIADLGPAGEPVRAATREDPSLCELLDSPLMLNIAIASYATETRAPVPINGTLGDRRDQLFGSYVRRVLESRGAGSRYSAEQTLHWLSWLASQMRTHGQTVFYLERLQIDWLPEGRHLAIRACFGLAFGLVIGFLFGLIVSLSYGLAYGLVVCIVASLANAIFWALPSAHEHPIFPVEIVRWSWPGLKSFSGGFSLVLGLGASLFSGLIIGLPTGLLVGFAYGLSYGLLVGLVGMLAIALVGVLPAVHENSVSTFELSRWSGPGLRSISLGLSLVIGLTAGMVFGLVGGVIGVLAAVLFSGLTFSEIEIKTIPNEGIRRSARNAILVTSVFGLVTGLAYWAVSTNIVGLNSRLRGELGAQPAVGFGLTLALALSGGLSAGGEACIKHYVLRLWLIGNGSTPWNYVRFLDHAAERVLLRKVGGGFMFLHRTLLDYFAARSVETAVRESPVLSPSAAYGVAGFADHITAPFLFATPHVTTPEEAARWRSTHNERRVELIVKRIRAGELDPAEEAELERLESEAARIQSYLFENPVSPDYPGAG
jgi:eukaryotic-like serine/threonine-protein kinase